MLPPLNEQRRIVAAIEALFDEIDRGVESLRTARRMIDLYRQSLLKSAFRWSSHRRLANGERRQAGEPGRVASTHQKAARGMLRRRDPRLAASPCQLARGRQHGQETGEAESAHQGLYAR